MDLTGKQLPTAAGKPAGETIQTGPSKRLAARLTDDQLTQNARQTQSWRGFAGLRRLGWILLQSGAAVTFLFLSTEYQACVN
jgi:hypothetical protein